MPCYSPLIAYRCANGDVVFSELKRYETVAELSLPCGQCIGCRLERAREWAMRCMHEKSLHERNCFVTLTYADEYLPKRGVLDYPEFQRFLKRLRKRFAPETVRFYMCGEYGEELSRPHYHACLFGADFDDKEYWKTTEAGYKLYTSELLGKLWPYGHSSVGALTFESAGYVARYCVQKVTGDDAELHYRRVDVDGAYDLPPEFNQMSRKPGIGYGFYRKWRTDMYPHDYVVVNGQESCTPRFYDKMYAREFPDSFEELHANRVARGRGKAADNTVRRLADKETVQLARLQFLRRNSL